MNVMKNIKIEKVTLNIGTGKSQEQLERGLKLLASIAKNKVVKTITQKRIAAWGLRPGLPIGCKVTLRRNDASDVLKKMIEARDFLLGANNFDDFGTVSFGIKEYIDIQGLKYNPDIGTMGLQVCVTLQRPGFRVKCRKIAKKKIPKCHRISQSEAVDFMCKNYNVKMRKEE
jgi:large subunit ribosomal protein L5